MKSAFWVLAALVLLAAFAPFFSPAGAYAAAPATGQFTYFYKPPQDGTAPSHIAALNSMLILTHNDEPFRDSVKGAGYGGLVPQYLVAAEVDGPGPYADSTAPCSAPTAPRKNQVAMEASDFCQILHSNESWFLHNSNGQRLYEVDGSRIVYHMNPAAPGWRAFFAQRALRELQGEGTYAPRGFDGLFLDNVWIGLDIQRSRLANSTGGVQEYASDGAYQSAMAGFLNHVRATLTTPNKVWPIYANFTSDQPAAYSWSTYLPYVDGGMDEAFAADWSTGYLSASGWKTDLDRAAGVLAQGKTFFAITQGPQSDANRARFGFASYLLVMQPGKSFYRYAYARTGYEYQWTYADYTLDLGVPQGTRYQQADGSWRRDFSLGYVTVNPTTRAVSFVKTPAPKPKSEVKGFISFLAFQP